MSTIAVLIGDMFEDSEYIKPAEAFKQAGHELVHVGAEAGKTVKGKTEGTQVRIDKAARDVSVDNFDAVFIPGGYSPDKLRINHNVVQFTKDFMDSGKPVLAICHAPQLLITAQAIKGRKITGYESIIQDIKNAGAEFIDRAVVEDENLISSRNPKDIPAFIDACLAKLKEMAYA